MLNSQQDISSLIAKFEQLEERQNITAKYAVGIKRELDELREKFNELQERFEQQLTLNNSLNGAKPINGLALNEAEVNADNTADEIDPAETDAVEQQEPSIPVFSDEEFKTLRLAQVLGAYGDMLLVKAYLAEEESQDKPLSAEEFWRKIKQGERDFTEVNLARVNLSGSRIACGTVDLSRANLSGANLSRVNGSSLKLGGANLKGADLSATNLEKANLTDADLSGANLTNVNLIEANLSGANLDGANLEQAFYDALTIFPISFNAAESGAYFITLGASLKNANLAGRSLNGVNLAGADLQGADLNSADLTQANLSEANLTGANLSKANLQQAKLLQANLNQAILTQANLSNADL
jgi:uncharacterized protein YjbI with pentapeptide repeats